jgi:hypothetical protein
MLLVAAGSALVTFEAFPLTLRIDYDSPTYLVIALHPELADSHQSAFLLLSCFLLAAVGAKMVPIKHAVPRVLFLFAFSYCAARTLLGYGFPLALNTNSPHHGTFQLPWLFCLASAFTATSAAIQSSLNSKAGSGSVLGMNMFIICACLPFGALLWSSLTGTFFEVSQGIFWCAAVTNASLSIAKRLTQLMREIKVRGAGSGYKKSIAEIREDTSSASICLITSSMCVLWTLSSSLLNPSTSSDINVPLSCLTLMCLNRKIRLIEVHPVALAGVAASTWWLVSGVYSIFVKGYATSTGMAHFELNVGIFGDENVSFWNTDGVWYPLMNLALLIIPLPAIALGFMRRKGESEDILFILAIMSLLPVICAQCSSVRLLGVMGTVFGAWRCYDVGVKQADSNRLI